MATRAKTLSTPTKAVATPPSSPPPAGAVDDFNGMTSPDSPFNKNIPGELAMKRASSYDSQKSPNKKKLSAQKAAIKTSENVMGSQFPGNVPKKLNLRTLASTFHDTMLL